MKISTVTRKNEHGLIEKKVQFGPREVEKLGVCEEYIVATDLVGHTWAGYKDGKEEFSVIPQVSEGIRSVALPRVRLTPKGWEASATVYTTDHITRDSRKAEVTHTSKSLRSAKKQLVKNIYRAAILEAETLRAGTN